MADIKIFANSIILGEELDSVDDFACYEIDSEIFLLDNKGVVVQ